MKNTQGIKQRKLRELLKETKLAIGINKRKRNYYEIDQLKNRLKIIKRELIKTYA